MAAVLIDDRVRADIAHALEQARANVIPWETMKTHVAGNQATATLNLEDRNPDAKGERPPSYCVTFSGSGVTACVSFEEQPAGILRHLSISTGRPERLVSPTIAEQICAEFGIVMLKAARIWVEEYKPGYRAVNVVAIEQLRTDHPTKQ